MKKRIEPGPGQESVWDYPRPPRLERCEDHLQVFVDAEILAETRESYRVLETSHPPVFYFPVNSVRMEWLLDGDHGSFCEWKGHAHYYALRTSDRLIPNFAWTYKSPTLKFSAIAGHLAFYPSKTDGCYVNGERVASQVGDFYGGWITKKIVGPFKGGPGTLGW